ncbi:MAG: HAMP domain-containing histidine kinase [Clostridiaceae bacterium]|nr:HAMP domain-containing histidine kinase [Clostridiaceae bacterium]
MSIKFRLLLSYIALLLVPIMLTIIVGIFAGIYYIEDFHRTYPSTSKMNTLRPLIEREALLIEIKQLSLKSPELFMNDDTLRQLDDRLQAFNSGVIIRKEDEIIYTSPVFHDVDILKDLPEFAAYAQEMSIAEEDENRRLKMNQHDFYFSDRSEGSIFLVTNIQPIRRAFQELVNTLTIAIVIILIATNGTLTYLVAGSIIKPLSKLKDSANKIKEGDLDFQIKVNRKDEIGELSHAFEEMRKRLKKSIDTQLQYEDNRKELLSNISHDLKTPITTIKGYVEGIRDGVADTPEKMEKYIDTIYKKTEDVDKLMDDLFLFSKLDLNKLPLHLTIIDISKYFIDLIEELRFDLEKKNVIIKYHCVIREPMVLTVDVIQLKRVVVNIIENAVKYMDKPYGTIDITLQKYEDCIQVQIKDNGQGISKEAVSFIFDRFYRADPSRNTSTGGSGLGLAIAKKIIEEHDGTMWAESEEGVGTSIFFTLKNHRSGDEV